MSTELGALESEFAERFVQITGYDYATEADEWDGVHFNPNEGSELETIEREINNRKATNLNLALQEDVLRIEQMIAEEAVTLADGIDDSITKAQASYNGTTSEAWTEIHTWAGAAAGTQAVTDAAFAASSVDGAFTTATGGVALGVAIASGTANTIVQTAAATRTSIREAEIDKAAVRFRYSVSHGQSLARREPGGTTDARGAARSTL